ncbi:MAG: hypothetical protein HY063_07100 [Bacteroidetes bacterium]|nr:hypothetical protein [Bacteroidota bacterium]
MLSICTGEKDVNEKNIAGKRKRNTILLSIGKNSFFIYMPAKIIRHKRLFLSA